MRFCAITWRSAEYVARSVSGLAPESTCPSFQPRFQPSCIDTFMPCPALALCVWQASPAMKTRGVRVPTSSSGTSSKRSVRRCPTSYTLCHGDILHIQPIGMQDVVRLRDDLVESRPPHGAVVVRGDLAEIDVHAEQEPALARDEEDVSRLGLDRALRPDVGEVGVRERIHDAPRVGRHAADVLRADRLADAAARAIRPDHVLGPHHPLLAEAVARRAHEGHPHRVLALADLEAPELPPEVGLHACRGVRHELGEVVEHPRLVDQQVRELADALLVIHRDGGADDARRVVRIGLPERHLGDAVRLGDDALREAERLEGLDAARLDAVGLTDLETPGASVHDARVHRRVHRQLRRGDDAGGPGADDQHIDLVRKLVRAIDSRPCCGKNARLAGDVPVVVELHGGSSSDGGVEALRAGLARSIFERTVLLLNRS